jgi:spermidine synthase
MSARWLDEVFRGDTRIGLRVQRMFYDHQSGFQSIQIFENPDFGRVLVLDGVFQTSEADEAVYHEMIAHPVLTVVERPERVLVIGGGDGGTVREVLRHAEVSQCVMVEIDRDVVDACRAHLPKLGGEAWEDPRLDLQYLDGIGYVAGAEEASFDVILLDATDPEGPSEGLYTEDFFRHCQRALRPGGALGLQSESFFLTDGLFYQIQTALRRVFARVSPYMAAIPLYACGYWTWTLASDELDWAAFDEGRAARLEPGCKYYGRAIHRAAFALPSEVCRRLAALDEALETPASAERG